MRELLWLIIGLLLAYVGLQLYRLRRDAAYTPDEMVDEPPVENFQTPLELSALRREIESVRAALMEEQQQREVLEESVSVLRTELEGTRLALGASPEYSEALVCARRGLDAVTIAEQCGISRAAAELVQALAVQRDDAREEG